MEKKNFLVFQCFPFQRVLNLILMLNEAVLGNCDGEGFVFANYSFVEIILRGTVERFPGNELDLKINLQMTKVGAIFELFCGKFRHFWRFFLFPGQKTDAFA